jgi:rubrerythrin
MNIEQAIITAIEYETRVREAYVEALEESSDPAGKRVFKLLADEEDGHVRYLNAKLKDWLEGGVLSAADLDTSLPPVEKIQAEVEKLEAALQKEDRGKEIAMLEKARSVEIETSDFYRRMTQELPPRGRRFFERFVEIENGHLALVEAEIDSLTGMGFWFEMSEFDLEAG